MSVTCFFITREVNFLSNSVKINNVLDYWSDLEDYSPQFPGARDIKQIDIYKKSRDAFFPDDLKKQKCFKYYNAIYIGKISLNTISDIVIKACSDKSIDTIEKFPGYTCACGFLVNEYRDYVPGSLKICPFFLTVTKLISSKSNNVNVLDSNNEKVRESFETIIIEALKNNISSVQLIEMFYQKYNIDINCERDEYLQLHSKIQPVPENCENVSVEIFDSFYKSDIQRIKNNITDYDSICNYINPFNNDNNSEDIRIDENIEQIKEWISPDKFPMGKWPSQYSPNLMQQIAINISISDKNIGDIFSINGPPGTGKTTLLKEVIASTIVKRAELFLNDDFNPNKNLDVEEINLENSDVSIKYYKLPEILKKYEIIVASNNNDAVENISMDLPKCDTVKKSLTNLFDRHENDDIYFSDISDALLPKNNKSWGLISVRLGKKSNIETFNKLIFPYYSNDDNIPPTKLASHYRDDHLKWEFVKSKFEEARDEVLKYRNEIMTDYKNSIKYENETVKLTNLKNLKSKYEKYLENNKKRIKRNEELINNISPCISIIKKFSSILNRKTDEYNKINHRYEYLIKFKLKLTEYQIFLNKKLDKIISKCNKQNKLVDELRIEIKNLKNKYGNNFVDRDFFKNIKKNIKSQDSCPWTYRKYDEAREKLFFYALQLHKCYILNSKCIRHNFSVLYDFWKGKKSFSEKQRKEMFPHLLTTLSLLVPVISTTFASVSSFLRYIDKYEMGMLIIDEAGQATPQSALGAIWRSQKILVVGDPLQVEPICNVPKFMKKILENKYFPNDYNVGYLKDGLSVQELADKVNRYIGIIKKTRVGCPLLIHRRCISPMFEISNEISYDNTMVNKTPLPNESFSIEQSIWIDISGTEKGNKNHFVIKQGDIVLSLIEKAYDKYKDDLFAIGQNKLFIITPFNSIADEIIKIVKKQYGYKIKSINPESDSVNEYLRSTIGTVHRFQETYQQPCSSVKGSQIVFL